ncbi:hypothetical protein LCGC14_1786700 [marine sediment metagenome]|uniref:Uncharacterized protein n=1 Tax=marine sediment metagenome TaxID=412755 RepID=A0A0F9GTQ1_9ZZZZ
MGLPLFGADSLLDSDTLTSSIAAASGFPVANLNDDRIFTVFKPTTNATLDIKTDAGAGNTSDVDYFGMVGHDLFTQGATITFARSTDDISYTTIFTTVVGDDKIVLRGFDKETFRFFRLRITGSTAAGSIGQLQWGTKVEVPFGIEVGFDPLDEVVRMRHTRSQSGNILGSVATFSERRASISLRLMPNTFVNGTTVGQFREFWDNHASVGKPFFWQWNAEEPVVDFEKDAFFAVIVNDAALGRPIVTPLASGERDISFDIVGLKE